MIAQQEAKLKILKKIQSSTPQTSDNYTSEFLDQAVDSLLAKKEEKIQKIRERKEIEKINQIKNSIYEKVTFQFDREIVDFGFVPISPLNHNKDTVVLVFVQNKDQDTKLVVQDMRGQTLLEHVIQNCSTKYLFPSHHPQDIFTGIL